MDYTRCNASAPKPLIITFPPEHLCHVCTVDRGPQHSRYRQSWNICIDCFCPLSVRSIHFVNFVHDYHSSSHGTIRVCQAMVEHIAWWAIRSFRSLRRRCRPNEEIFCALPAQEIRVDPLQRRFISYVTQWPLSALTTLPLHSPYAGGGGGKFLSSW